MSSPFDELGQGCTLWSKIDHVPSPPLPSVSIPLPTQGAHQTWTCGPMLGTDRHSIMTLRYQLHASLIVVSHFILNVACFDTPMS